MHQRFRLNTCKRSNPGFRLNIGSKQLIRLGLIRLPAKLGIRPYLLSGKNGRILIMQRFPKSAPRTTGGLQDWLKWSLYKSIFSAPETTKLSYYPKWFANRKSLGTTDLVYIDIPFDAFFNQTSNSHINLFAKNIPKLNTQSIKAVTHVGSEH